jgi:hypothetical protein
VSAATSTSRSRSGRRVSGGALFIRRSRIAAAVSAVLVGCAVAVAPAAPAAAATCASQYFCVWYFTGFNGLKWSWIGNDRDWSNNYNDGVAANNNDASWANNGVYCYGCDHVRVYDKVDYKVLTLCVHRGQWIDNEDGPVPAQASVHGSSHKWGGECGAGDPHIPYP